MERVEEREMREIAEETECKASTRVRMKAGEEKLDEGRVVGFAQYHTGRRRGMTRPRSHMSVP